jgi:hypothetical protein
MGLRRCVIGTNEEKIDIFPKNATAVAGKVS